MEPGYRYDEAAAPAELVRCTPSTVSQSLTDCMAGASVSDITIPLNKFVLFL